MGLRSQDVTKQEVERRRYNAYIITFSDKRASHFHERIYPSNGLVPSRKNQKAAHDNTEKKIPYLACS